MMKAIYELWDDDTGNLLDAYDTEQAALKEVRSTIQIDGRDAVATWTLLRDDTKSPAKTVVATGAELAAYATDMQPRAV